jgi:hypothetical protein
MLGSFVQSVIAFPDEKLCVWLIDGLIRYHTEDSPSYQRAEVAFEAAEYSFGRGEPGRRAVSDLLELAKEVNVLSPSRFDRVVARSIDLIALNTTSRKEALRDLIELALETKNGFAIEAVTRKLRIPDAELRRLICLDAVYFLREGNSQPQMLELGRYIVDQVDFPFEAAAHLLVGLAVIDPDNSGRYAEAIESKLLRQLVLLEQHPERLEYFRSEFVQAVLMASNSSQAVNELLKMPTYAALLDGKIAAMAADVDDEMEPSAVMVTPVGVDWRRFWRIVDFDKLCAVAKRTLATKCPGIKSSETLSLVDSQLA